MKTKLTNTERATKAGKARWANISSKKRTDYARANGKKLWDKIRKGELASKLDK